MTRPPLDLPQERLYDICRRFHVRELSLFGSALRDDFGPDSDIDILVEFEPGARIGFMALGAMEQELQALLGRRVDLVPKKGLRPFIRDEILSSRQILYAA